MSVIRKNIINMKLFGAQKESGSIGGNYLNIEMICRNTPWIIIGYFSIQYICRILISTNLEVDESQLVGATDLQFIYNNSHPPLYNWLARLVLELTGWNWSVGLPLLKNILLGSAYLLGFDLVRRVTGSTVAATLGVTGLLLMPEIVWQSQVTLTHSVLVTFAAIATLHALVLVLQRGAWTDYLWFAIALSIGTNAKFNFLFFLGAVLLVMVINPHARRLISPARGLMTATVYLLLTGPTFIAVLLNFSQSSERMRKLYKDSGTFFDLPWLGIDGLINMAGALVSSMGIFALVVFIVYRVQFSRKADYSIPLRRFLVARVFGMIALVGLGGFAAMVLLGDMHDVHQRYITPLLVIIPFYLILRWPVEQNREVAKGLIRLAGCLVLAAIIGVNAMVIFGKHALAFPYKEFAIEIEKKFGENLHILSNRDREQGNIIIKMRSAQLYRKENSPDKVVLVWRPKWEGLEQSLAGKLGSDYAAQGEIFEQQGRYYYKFSGSDARLNARLYVRGGKN